MTKKFGELPVGTTFRFSIDVGTDWVYKKISPMNVECVKAPRTETASLNKCFPFINHLDAQVEVIMPTKKITAKEARELAGPTVEEHVEAAFEEIRKAATEKKRRVALHGPFWTNGGYGRTNDYKEACKLLEKEGFEVEFYYEEKQFVDMYTVVKW